MIFEAKTSIKKGKMISSLKFIGSPNFDTVNKRRIKYIIIHFTGMKDQISAIQRLQSKVAKVSSHYLISKRGNIFQQEEDVDFTLNNIIANND